MDAADGGSGREMDAEGGGPGMEMGAEGGSPGTGRGAEGGGSRTGDGADGRSGTSRFWQPPTLLGKQLLHTRPCFTLTQFVHFP